jgi:hypothetical protein
MQLVFVPSSVQVILQCHWHQSQLGNTYQSLVKLTQVVQ